jgi:uncharacterized small protein (DUF1192 family)
LTFSENYSKHFQERAIVFALTIMDEMNMIEIDSNSTECLTGSDSRKAKPTEASERKIPIVFFGRLEERKGLRTFVEALQCLDSSLRQKIEIKFLGKVVSLYSAELCHLNSQQYIERELKDRVPYEIISNLYSAQAIQYIRNLDHPIVCLTSPEDNFPNTALEMGQLPVNLVVSDTGGFRETLQLVNRQSGLYWFKPKDADSLALMISKAALDYSQIPTVSSRTELERVNQDLLAKRLEHIEQAFMRAVTPDESPLPKIMIAIPYYNQGKLLPDCLARIEAQTYANVEVIVVDDGSTEEYSRDLFDRYSSLLPNCQFIQLETRQGLGAVRNFAVAQSTGDYFLAIDPHVLLMPFALEKFAEAARQSGAAIVTCPRKEVGAVERLVNFPGGSLPVLLQSNVYGQGCHLFSLPLLKKFQQTESKDIRTQSWETIAAAVVIGEKIITYPYPLYEYRVTEETGNIDQPHPREQYSLRQYLAKIPPAQWSPRQIYMLLTAIQQLQNSPPVEEEAHSRIAALQSENHALHAEISKLRSQIAVLQPEIERIANEAHIAKERVNAMETSKFWKLRSRWFHIKRAVGLPTSE